MFLPSTHIKAGSHQHSLLLSHPPSSTTSTLLYCVSCLSICGMSDLSTSSDDGNQVQVVEPPPQPAEVAVPASIGSAGEHPLVTVTKVPLLNGLGKLKTTWKCLAPGCGKEWNGANSSKALAHGSRDKKYCMQVHVKACTGSASQAEIDLFCSLLKNKDSKKNAKKRADVMISEDIISSQETVADGINAKKKSRRRGSGGSVAVVHLPTHL